MGHVSKDRLPRRHRPVIHGRSWGLKVKALFSARMMMVGMVITVTTEMMLLISISRVVEQVVRKIEHIGGPM